MLILTRKFGEKIVINLPQGQIVIHVMPKDEKRSGIKIGIDAPKEFNIVRAEIIGKPRREVVIENS